MELILLVVRFDVMISYIAEKNGGTAVYSEKSIFGIIVWDKKVTVTIVILLKYILSVKRTLL